MNSTFGSTKKEESPFTDNEVMAKNVRAKTATIAGLSAEAQIQKQQISNLYMKLEHMTNLIGTLQNQLQALNQARARELNLRVGGAATSV